MGELIFPVLAKLVWLVALAPAALAVAGIAKHRTVLLRVAYAMWTGAMIGALAATALWFLGYPPA